VRAYNWYEFIFSNKPETWATFGTRFDVLADCVFWPSIKKSQSLKKEPFDNVEMPVVLIDREMRIRRFTKDAQHTLTLDTADLKRPISHLQASLVLPRSNGGLGIGLTLVRRLVELHGGSVEARSEGPGRGRELIVQLPVLADPAPETAGLTQSPGPQLDQRGSRRRILVVDDHEDSVTIMAALLRTRGYDVAIALHGAAAIEIATAFCPDLVILDIGLPGIDGYEVARRLRKIPAVAATAIVGLSG
jgi:CheY-like chemotaxis protein